LARYLKALGILRVLTEQGDHDARGWWAGEQFLLRTEWTAEALNTFFLQQYVPTPIVAPWNAGSGFWDTKEQDAFAAIRNATSPRFELYRYVIRLCLGLVHRLGISEELKDEEKNRLIRVVRNQVPDAVLPWVDTAVILTGPGATFPPLVGTGGNDGRLDFTLNFMQQLVRLFDPTTGRPQPEAAQWLEAALWQEPTPGLVHSAIGQFYPGAAGGPNAAAGFEGEPVVNPWDFVLMLEGAIMLAAASHRRLTPGARDFLAAPFVVRTVPVGQGSLAGADRAASRAEVWMPLWKQPAHLTELQWLFREGRAQVGRRPARTGLDFARACATLAVDRGLTAFQRYGLLMRAGRSYLATPLTRVVVQRRVEGDLLNELDAWLAQAVEAVRDKKAPAALERAVRRVQDAAFDMVRLGGAHYVQRLLAALADAEWTLSQSPGLRAKLGPMPRLSGRWSVRADDGSATFRLAQALASLRHPTVGGLRGHWSAAVLTPETARWPADNTQSSLRVWIKGSLEDSLMTVLLVRFLHAQGGDPVDKPTDGYAPVDLDDVAAWLKHPEWDDDLESLALGLSLVPEDGGVARSAAPAEASDEMAWLPRAYAPLRMVLAPDALLRRACSLPDEVRVPVPGRLLGLLRANRAEEAGREALRRPEPPGWTFRSTCFQLLTSSRADWLLPCCFPSPGEDSVG
jgi:CRISPR-associated protein Csx17